jgi:hypothetical protein
LNIFDVTSVAVTAVVSVGFRVVGSAVLAMIRVPPRRGVSVCARVETGSDANRKEIAIQAARYRRRETI